MHRIDEVHQLFTERLFHYVQSKNLPCAWEGKDDPGITGEPMYLREWLLPGESSTMLGATAPYTGVGIYQVDVCTFLVGYGDAYMVAREVHQLYPKGSDLYTAKCRVKIRVPSIGTPRKEDIRFIVTVSIPYKAYAEI